MSEALVEDVRRVLAEADADIAARKPVCRASGRCCKFEMYGHRLYVTGVEMVAFERSQKPEASSQNKGSGVGGQGSRENAKCETRNAKGGGRDEASGGSAAQVGKTVSLTQFFSGEKVEGCPYQVEGLCMAREGRPLGCRIYFCDENAQHWQNEVYEKYHGMLRALHEKHGVPYRYVEWRAALRELMAEGV